MALYPTELRGEVGKFAIPRNEGAYARLLFTQLS